MRRGLAERFSAGIDNLVAIATLAAQFAAALADTVMDALAGRTLPEYEMKKLRVAAGDPANQESESHLIIPRHDEAA
ncbi:MAG: hypothetical protein DMG68_12710 [Acidobacteria bacterium]|nr:MAG: hypothetical protein DMG68_12710 [Acidobacteriota bacterium]